MNIYRSIDRKRYEFHFAVQYPESGFYDQEIRELGGRILIQPHPRKGLSTFRKQFIHNVTNYGPYDAIHSHIFQFSGYIVKMAADLQIPVRITHSHTVTPQERTTWRRKVYQSYMRWLISKHSTHLIGCSESACESLFGRACWGDTRTELIPNAINLAPYEQLPADRSRLKERLGVTDPTVQIIGHIGRFSEEKNHRFLIETFAQYVELQPNARLVLVGDGKLRQEMETLSEGLGIRDQIMFLGIRKDIPELIGAFDLFLLPSLYEGLGMVVIEAQAGGVPSMVSEYVPPEANLGLEMVKHLKLQSQVWIEGMTRMNRRTATPDWSIRYSRLQEQGYDIHTNIQRLEKIYHA